MRLLSLEEQKEIESKINNYKSMNIKNINASEIDNIDNIKIDENLEPEERVIDFLKKVSNPYFFNIDGYVVKFSYQENGVEAEECIHDAIKQIINK